MREQSLLDEMRAAVRGDRERAEKRKAQESHEPSEIPPAPEPVEPEPVEPEVEAAPPQEDGFWGRLTRRSRST